jgi:hypothetical protein
MGENGRSNRQKFFEAIDECYEALFSAIGATEDRGHRVSTTLLEETRKGEREVTALAQKWVDSPGSVYDNLGAMVDAQLRAQHRALELAREALGGAGDYGKEMQDALTRLIRANRAAAEATVEAVRGALTARQRRGRHLEVAHARPARTAARTMPEEPAARRAG